MKSDYADLLNALVEMQSSPAYAVRRGILQSAEFIIADLEQKLRAALARTPAEAAGAVAWYRETAAGGHHICYIGTKPSSAPWPDGTGEWLPLYTAAAPSHAEQAIDELAFFEKWWLEIGKYKSGPKENCFRAWKAALEKKGTP